MSPSPTKNILVLGGGVAALETLLALRDLAGERVAVTLVAPESEFTYRPLTVAEPFALGRAERHSLQGIADDLGAQLVRGAAEEVVPEQHLVRLVGGRELSYDELVIAVGARPVAAFARGITFGESDSYERLQGLLADAEGGYLKRIAFVVPGGSSWPLPLYEIALMAAAEIRGMGIDDAEITLITTEPAPLNLFGAAASDSIAELLHEAGIEFAGSTHASLDGHKIMLAPGHRTLEVDRIVTLPALLGPGLRGLPGDSSGFIPTDDHGRVTGVEDVYAAGDATTFPIKQGGIAAQQADAIAQMIAGRVGANVTAQPFRPLLRGVLLTGGQKQFLRHAAAGGGRKDATDVQPLWWPPTKIAGHYLSPYLYGRQERQILDDRPVDEAVVLVDYAAPGV